MSKYESEFLKWLRQEQHSNPKILGPFDDDTATLRAQSSNIITSTDMFIEDIHFDLRYWKDNKDIGYKAVVHSISDVFSKLVEPNVILVNACFSKNCTFDSIKESIWEFLKR